MEKVYKTKIDSEFARVYGNREIRVSVILYH